MSDTPQVLLTHHLKALRLPTSCASTTSWLANVLPRASTILATWQKFSARPLYLEKGS